MVISGFKIQYFSFPDSLFSMVISGFKNSMAMSVLHVLLRSYLQWLSVVFSYTLPGFTLYLVFNTLLHAGFYFQVLPSPYSIRPLSLYERAVITSSSPRDLSCLPCVLSDSKQNQIAAQAAITSLAWQMLSMNRRQSRPSPTLSL